MKITNSILKNGQENMNKVQNALQHELSSLRAGRANASLLSNIQVEYYGTYTPLNQISQISIPEARVLMITPYDKTSLKAIEHALLVSDLGLNPLNDGKSIRLVIPQLTEERRKELAKKVKAIGERSKNSIRHFRRDIRESLKKSQKAGDLTEDDLHDLEDQTQSLTDESIRKVDVIVSDKEKEILND